MIAVEKLGKRFSAGRGPAVVALDDLSLRAGPGVTGIVGPNGAGKSTLLALLLGFLRPGEGTVRIAGAPPRTYLRRHGAAFLPERFQLPASWGVRAALRGLARLDGLAGSSAASAADDALARFGLEAHADRAVGELSRGLLQRVGLAQAFLARRELVVLDEPAEGLDPLWRIRLRTLVLELGREGRTVLLASHDIAEMERTADRVLVLDGGRLLRVLDVQPQARPLLEYRLLATGAAADPTPFFDDPVPEPPAGWRVAVRDTGELSRRLEAFLAAGGEIVSLEPLRDDLERRVARTLSGEDG
jgi:ABC-2 type transport system ATP-binding protein